MASFWYTKGLEDALGSAAFFGGSSVFRVMLLRNTYTPDVDHDFVDDIDGDEMTGAARKTLGSLTVTRSTANDNVVIDAADPSVYSALDDGTLAGAAIYRQVGGNDATPEDDPLWLFIDVEDLVTNGGDVTLAFHSTGLGAVGV